MVTVLAALFLSAAPQSTVPTVRYLKVKDVAGKVEVTFDAPYGAPEDKRVKLRFPFAPTNDRCIHALCPQLPRTT